MPASALQAGLRHRHIDLSHEAATPPGLAVTVVAELTAVEGRRLRFAVTAEDGVETVARGTHERHVIDAARFSARVAAKAGAPRDGSSPG